MIQDAYAKSLFMAFQARNVSKLHYCIVPFHLTGTTPVFLTTRYFALLSVNTGLPSSRASWPQNRVLVSLLPSRGPTSLTIGCLLLGPKNWGSGISRFLPLGAGVSGHQHTTLHDFGLELSVDIWSRHVSIPEITHGLRSTQLGAAPCQKLLPWNDTA